MTEYMKETATQLFKDLRDEGYDLIIGKKDYCKIENISQSGLNHRLTTGDVPPYFKTTDGVNAPVKFMLRDVADYLAAKMVRV